MGLPISDPDLLYDNEPLSAWRNAARKSQEALRKNPGDPEAMMTFNDARSVLREHAQRVGGMMDAGNRQQSVDQFADISPGASFGSGFLRSSSGEMADEIGGAGRAYASHVRGESPQQAYLRNRDAIRADQATLEAANPGWELAGQATGVMFGLPARIFRGASSLLRAPVGGVGANAVRAGESVSALAAAARPGASLAQQAAGAASTGLGGAATAGAMAYGAGEEGPVADLRNVPPAAAFGFGAGFIGSAVGSAAVRGRRVNVDREATGVLRRDLEQLRVERELAMKAQRESRAVQMVNRGGVQSMAPATRAVDPDAAFRARLVQQGFPPAYIERAVSGAAARRAGGTPLSASPAEAAAARNPQPMSPAELDRIGTAPEIPPFIQAPTTAAEAAALPGSYRPDAGLVRGRHGMVDPTVTGITEETRNFARFLGRSPAEQRQILSGMDASQLERMRQLAREVYRYGAMTSRNKEQLAILLGPLE